MWTLVDSLLVDGYIRSIQRSIARIIPYPINEICLQFYYTAKILLSKNSSLGGLYFANFDINTTDFAIKTHQTWKCKVHQLNDTKVMFDGNNTHWKHTDTALLYHTNVNYSKSISQKILNGYDALKSKYIDCRSYHTLFKCGARGSAYCCAMILHPQQFSNQGIK